MAYFTKDDLTGYLPQEWLKQGVDDSAAHAEGLNEIVFAQIQSAVETRVKATLEPAYTIPDPPDSFVKYAAILLAVDHVYRRRGVIDHPWKAEVDRVIERMAAIQSGEITIDADANIPAFDNALTSTPLIFSSAFTGGAY